MAILTIQVEKEVDAHMRENYVPPCPELARLAQMCPHGLQQYHCRECGGKGICPHGKERSLCLDGCHPDKERKIFPWTVEVGGVGFIPSAI
jgi:hypothetical protein